MALIVEDGTGVADAESYADVAFIDAHWAARPHLDLSEAWSAADTAAKEGAAREAAAYLDALLSDAYRGVRASYDQGLEWPRSEALDKQGLTLPGVPPQLKKAVAELAGRAITAPLSEDQDLEGDIKRTREKYEGVEFETEYLGSASGEGKYGVVLKSLNPILNGKQSGAAPSWSWR